MDDVKLLLFLLLIVLCSLWVLFTAVKLSTYAFFKGRALYYKEEEKLNGKKSQEKSCIGS